MHLIPVSYNSITSVFCHQTLKPIYNAPYPSAIQLYNVSILPSGIKTYI